jgi:hypothetical protein
MPGGFIKAKAIGCLEPHGKTLGFLLGNGDEIAGKDIVWVSETDAGCEGSGKTDRSSSSSALSGLTDPSDPRSPFSRAGLILADDDNARVWRYHGAPNDRDQAPASSSAGLARE